MRTFNVESGPRGTVTEVDPPAKVIAIPPMSRSCGHTEGERHNCEYVKAVNHLISGAERMAHIRLLDYIEKEGPINRHECDLVWTALFHEEMQSDCESVGLRRPGPPHPPRRDIIEVEDRTL